MFRQMDLRGQTRSNTQLETVHQNTISTVRVYEERGGVVKKFSSKFSNGFMYELHKLTYF